jgi:hypothetical protein
MHTFSLRTRWGLSLVACAVLPHLASAQVTLSDDRALDGIAYSPASGDQDHVTVAYGGGRYVSTFVSRTLTSPHYRIYIAPVDPNTGGVAGPATSPTDALLVAAESDTLLDNPAIAFDGTQFILSWQEQTATNVHVMTRTLSATGTTLGTPIDHTDAAVADQGPQIVVGGDQQALLVWKDRQRLKGLLLEASGGSPIALMWPEPSTYRVPLDPTDPQNLLTTQHSAAGAFGNQRYEVAFVDDYSTDGADLYGLTVLAQNGTLSAPVRLPANAAGPSPTDLAVGFGNGTFLVAFNDFEGGRDADLYGRLLDANGVPMGTTGLTISQLANNQFGPQIAFVSGRFLVAWEQQDALFLARSVLYGRRVNPNGTMAETNETLLDPLASSPGALLPYSDWRAEAVATNGTDWMVTWTHTNAGLSQADALATPIVNGTDSTPGSGTFNGRPTPTPGLLSVGINLEQDAMVARSGQVFLVVWADSRDAVTLDLFGMRVDRDGHNIDLPPAPPQAGTGAFLIAANIAEGTTPAVSAIPGGDFLVAWVDPSNAGDIKAARVPQSGAVGTPAVLTIANGSQPETEPAVVGVPDGWLVAWGNGSNILYRKVSAAGSLGTPTSVPPDVNFVTRHPTLAFDGTHVLLAYQQLRPPQVTADLFFILGRWLDTAGTDLGQTVTIANGVTTLEQPTAAGNAGSVVVAWTQTLINSRFLLSERALDPTTMGAAVALANLANAITAPQVAMSSPYVVTSWNDSRGGGAQRFAARSILDTTATKQLTVIEQNGFPLLTDATMPQYHDGGSAVLDDGRTLFTYVVNETAIGGTARVHARVGGAHRLGDFCTGGAGCDSGFCAAGVCCESACGDICQKCDRDGRCDVAPADDARCTTTDCSTLQTECVSYQAAARCEGFGACRLPGDLQACTPQPRPDGTACQAAGCQGQGQCAGGACVCASFQSGPSPRQIQPQFADQGCQAGPGRAASGGATLALVLLMIAGALRRRRSALVAALVASTLGAPGCGEDKGGLIVHLNLAGQASRTASVRFILAPNSTPGFPAAAPASPPAGVAVYAEDVDGDGARDEVVEVDHAYFRGETLSVELTPGSGGAFGITVRAWAIDATGNRFATTDRLPAAVKPGETPSVALALRCLVAGCGPTADLQVDPLRLMDNTQTPLGAVAAGHLTRGQAEGDVAIGIPGSPPGGDDPQGRVRLVLAATNSMSRQIVATPTAGPEALGDRFGAALAIGDLDGDGVDDLAVGAPGHGVGRGALFVLPGRDSWPDTLPSLDTPALFGQDGDGLGAALAAADLDGDGKAELVAGAAHGQAIYLIRTGVPAQRLAESSIPGFGAAVAARAGGDVLVGAPASNRVRLYHFDGSALVPVYDWASSGGGFGTQVALADLDGDGQPDLIVGAPGEGAGVVYILRAADRTGTQGEVSNTRSAALEARSVSPRLAQLGGTLAVLPAPGRFGDGVVMGSPGGTPDGYLVAGPMLVARPFLVIDDGQAPVAARLTVPLTSSEVLLPLAGADLDADGAPDLVAASLSGLYVFRGVPW